MLFGTVGEGDNLVLAHLSPRLPDQKEEQLLIPRVGGPLRGLATTARAGRAHPTFRRCGAMRFLSRAQGESMQKWGRSVSSGRHGLVQGCTACSVRWSVPAWRRCADAFAVKRGGYLQFRDAMGREFLIKNRDPDLRHAMCPFVGPAHLLLLGHAVADDLVHRGLGYAAADR
jgi:hypothetical protein